jgi:hypothetical protein
MVPPLSRRHVVHWRNEDGRTYCELALLADCAIGTIGNIPHFRHFFEQSANPFGYWPGQPPMLDARDMEFLDELLKREPCLFLDKLQGRL